MNLKRKFRFALSGGLILFAGCAAQNSGNQQNTVTDIRLKGIPECPLYFPKLILCAELIPQEEPLKLYSFDNVFKLKIWSANRNSTRELERELVSLPHVWLWMKMPSGDHGSANLSIVRQLDTAGNAIPGDYKISNVYLSMRGKWEIHIQLPIDEVTNEEVVHEFKI